MTMSDPSFDPVGTFTFHRGNKQLTSSLVTTDVTVATSRLVTSTVNIEVIMATALLYSNSYKMKLNEI